MLPSTFDRETILDLTVNMIPLGILLFFIVAFGLFNPFGWNSVVSTLQFGILIAAFVLLAVLTYYAGKAVSKAEAEMDGDEDHTA
ncbi:MAG: DUF6684 family protein [Halorientalis sp.]